MAAAVDTLAALLPTVPELAELRDRVVSTIGGTLVFDVGRLAIEARTSATADGASATVVCTATDVHVLGATPLPQVDCDVLGAALVGAGDVLRELLGSLPVDVPVEVAFGGLRATTDVDEDPEAGVNAASASVSALRARVGSIGLTPTHDLLTDELAGLIGEVDGSIELLDLAGLAAAVAELPTGEGLAGLRTSGVDLEVAAVDVHSDFTATSAGTEGREGDGPDAEGPGDPTPGTGTDATPGGDRSDGDDPASPGDGPDGTPGAPDGTSGAPDDDPSRDRGAPGGAPDLPRTGGGVPLLALALLLVATLRRPGRR